MSSEPNILHTFTARSSTGAILTSNEHDHEHCQKLAIQMLRGRE